MLNSAEAGVTLDRSDWWQRRVGFALLVLVYWLIHFTAPDARHLTDQLDDSWRQGLGIALAQGMRFGHDIVFNQGPLGYFRESPPNLDLLVPKLVYWEVGFKLAAALVSFLPLLVLRGPLVRALYVIGILIPSSGSDGFAFVTIAGGSFFLLERCGERSLLVPRGVVGLAQTLVPIVIAITMHVKFTYCGLAIAGLGSVCLRLLADRRFVRSLELVVLTSGAYLATWTICGQQLGDLPNYLRGALAIASGYNVAMVEFGNPHDVTIAVQIFALAAALVIAKLFVARKVDGSRTVLACALLAATLLLTFKAGFTRHYGSSVLFFHAAAYAPLFLSLPHPATKLPGLERWLERLHPWFIAGIIGYAYLGTASARDFAPKELPHLVAITSSHAHRALEDLDQWSEGRLVQRLTEEVDHWRSRTIAGDMEQFIGSSTVDVFGARQGFVFGTQMRWRPRPIFQSYSAYESYLLELNAAFYRGPNAPQFVLLESDTLDDRLPTACDTLAIQEVLRRYDFVRFENNFVVLERSEHPREAKPRQTLLAGRYHLSEWIDLPQFDTGCRVLHLDLEPTFRARVKSFLYHVDLPQLDVELSDGSIGQFRLVPDALRAGVLFDPLCRIGFNWAQFLSEAPMPHAKRIRVVPPDRMKDAYGDTVAVRLVRANDLLPPAAERPDLAPLFPSFSPAPSRAESPQPMSVVSIADTSANVLHPPGVLTFELAPGRYRLHAQVGLVESSWSEHETDGVSFLIGIDGARKSQLFARHLDPRRNEADRAPLEIDLEFEIGSGEVLRVATTFGSRGDSSYDWSYVGPLTIERDESTK